MEKDNSGNQRKKQRNLIGTIKAAIDAVKSGREKVSHKNGIPTALPNHITKYQWYQQSEASRKRNWKRKTQRAKANFISNRKVS